MSASKDRDAQLRRLTRRACLLILAIILNLTVYHFATTTSSTNYVSWPSTNPADTHQTQQLKIPECLRNSSNDKSDCFRQEDRISTIHFKLLADHLLGFYNVPDTHKSTLDNIRISSERRIEDQVVRNGSVIFVEPGSLSEFIKLAPRITVKFILITGDGDDCMPRCILSDDETIALAGNRLLIKWFATNCVGKHLSRKIECIPIGLNQHTTAIADMQSLYESGIGLVNGIEPKKWGVDSLKEKYLLASFNVNSKASTRLPVYDYFCGMKGWPSTRSITLCYYNNSMDFLSFQRDIVSPSTFVISPPGNGLDCYRTWETLFMGNYPVVLSSSLDPLYAQLPVIVVQSWAEVTPRLLQRKLKEFQWVEHDYRRLYMQYWTDRIRSAV
ncbi:hypothetical protein HDU77_002342 [Chytriomyces hyalinus]|nr:hypothetical protein HDU77_002342 [Chytriomyces hyalinus]